MRKIMLGAAVVGATALTCHPSEASVLRDSTPRPVIVTSVSAASPLLAMSALLTVAPPTA